MALKWYVDLDQTGNWGSGWYGVQAASDRGISDHTPSGTNETFASLTSDNLYFTFHTIGDVHDSNTFPTTGYDVSLDVSEINSGFVEVIVSLERSATSVSNGVLATNSQNSAEEWSMPISTGIQTTTMAWTNANSMVVTDATDIVYIQIFGNHPSGMATSRTIRIRASDADTFLENANLNPPSSTPTIVCPVITASSTLFNPTIINTQELVFNVLNVPGTILNPSITPPPQTVQFQVITAASTLPNPSVVHKIILPVINVTSSLFNPSTVYDVILPVVVTTSTINNPSVLHRFLISMQVLNASSTIFSPTVNQDIALNVLNTTSTIFSPSLNQDVVLPVLNAPDNVLMPATDTSVNIELLFVADDSTIFDPALNQDISLDVYNAPATVPNPEVTSVGAEQDISLVVIDASSTVLNPSVTTLTTVVAQVLDSPSTVFSPSLKYDVVVPVINTVSTIFSPSLEQIVQMQFIDTSPVVHAPRIGEEVDDGFSGAIIDKPGFPPFPIGIR